MKLSCKCYFYIVYEHTCDIGQSIFFLFRSERSLALRELVKFNYAVICIDCGAFGRRTVFFASPILRLFAFISASCRYFSFRFSTSLSISAISGCFFGAGSCFASAGAAFFAAASFADIPQRQKTSRQQTAGTQIKTYPRLSVKTASAGDIFIFRASMRRLHRSFQG